MKWRMRPRGLTWGEYTGKPPDFAGSLPAHGASKEKPVRVCFVRVVCGAPRRPQSRHSDRAKKTTSPNILLSPARPSTPLPVTVLYAGTEDAVLVLAGAVGPS